MAIASLAPLRALLTRSEQLEERASRALGDAIIAHDAALAAVASVERVRTAREASLGDARRRGRAAAEHGSTALAIADHDRFVARCRDEWMAARRDVETATRAAAERAAVVSQAREALARAKGDRDAVSRRIEAALAEARRVAENKAEDEAGDRVGAAQVARATDRRS